MENVQNPNLFPSFLVTKAWKLGSWQFSPPSHFPGALSRAPLGGGASSADEHGPNRLGTSRMGDI